jgi:hypothetical protein
VGVILFARWRWQLSLTRRMSTGYPVFADLNKYDATTHFVGQGTIFTLVADRATGEAYCLAHHVTVDGGKRRLMIASLRYLDTFVKADGAWLFAERLLYVDWVDERPRS